MSRFGSCSSAADAGVGSNRGGWTSAPRTGKRICHGLGAALRKPKQVSVRTAADGQMFRQLVFQIHLFDIIPIVFDENAYQNIRVRGHALAGESSFDLQGW